uniref:LAGLIDADG endonuclease type 2 n=1 Tax=Amanita muscaria TaxID=41956 RepID=A0A5Q0N266_AMAMU|nr:LAGLIDADG endonuclease type 2 [Amanita muscaria]QFZ98625.1 LAGLIDADG endonuclease type 2 [Amanita muscaria]
MIKILKQEIIGLGPNSTKIKEYKNSLLELTSIQKEAIIGLMLGDASLQSQNKGKTYRIKFEWGNKNKVYALHVFELFDEWVLSQPHKKDRLSPQGNLVINWGFQTFSHIAFNYLADLFFKNGKKSIPDNLILDHLTSRGLAYWFMDDGGKLDYNKNSKNKSVVLNTQSFTELEVQKMSEQLINKFDLLCEVRSNKNKKVIVIKDASYPKFYELISPYLVKEMRYKLPNDS